MEVFRNTSPLIILYFYLLYHQAKMVLFHQSSFHNLILKIMRTYFPLAAVFLHFNINGPNQSGLDLISRFISRM